MKFTKEQAMAITDAVTFIAGAVSVIHIMEADGGGDPVERIKYVESVENNQKKLIAALLSAN